MPAPLRINAAKLAEARIRAGLTQSGLAARVGVNKSSINRIEAGKSHMPRCGLPAIAAALGCDLDDITERTAA